MTASGKPTDPALHKLTDRPIPTSVGKNQVLVKVVCAALNPIDYKLCEGKIPMAKLPMYTGFDFAGIVEEAGGESGFTKGMEVFGDMANVKGITDPIGGSLSEYILVGSNIVAKKPAKCTAAEAAALSLVGQTVLDCLTAAAQPAGARVLVLGASGGVGTAAIQILKARGFYVIGVCSGKNVDLVKSLGADEVIDYRQSDWAKELQQSKVRCVFDFAPSGQDSTASWHKSKLVLGPNGTFVTISGPDPEGRMMTAGVVGFMICNIGSVLGCCSNFRYKIVLKKSTSAKLNELAKLVDEGQLKAVIEKIYGFEEVIPAFEHLMSGRAVGKICVKVDKAA